MHMRTWATLMVAMFLVPVVAADGSHSLEGSHLFELTSVSALNSLTSSGTNCVSFKQGAEGLTGTATATWAAQSALTETLEVVLVVFRDGDNEYFRTTGTSPLRLTVDDVDVPPADEEWPLTALLAVQLADQGIAFDQEVLFDYAFTYDGVETLEPSEGGCAIG